MFGGYQNFGERLTPAVKGLLIATVAAGLLQGLADIPSGGGLTAAFGLALPDVLRGRLWQLATYALLHANGWHLLFNMLGLFFFGPDVERTVGSRRFLRLYALCGILAGIGWLLITALPRQPTARCIGASGAVFGVLGAFAALYPDRPVTLLVAFILPVTLRARTLAFLLGAVALVSLRDQAGGVAHAAHLAGGVAGYLAGLRWRRFRMQPYGWRHPEAPPRKPRRRWRWPWQPRPRLWVRPPPEEVDRILDKIGREGMAGLTRGERETLRAASEPGTR